MSPPSRFLLLLLSAALLSSLPPRCPALALAQNTVTHLPGFHGPLPFHMETGYVGVDDRDDVQLFYYFLPSEGDPAEDPLLLWLTGGPGCSAFSGLAFEIGPIAFLKVRYDGNLPTLVLNPYSWTKIANIIFLDSPVGTGFSSRNPEGYKVGDMSSSKQVETFIRKWLVDHPQFISNPFYLAGDSYAGKVVPIIAHLISAGIRVGHKPLVNLKGYLIGNAITGESVDTSSNIPFVHGMGIISDELYEMTMKYCGGQDYEYPTTTECAENLFVVDNFISEIKSNHILEPKCLDFVIPMGNRGIRCRKSLQLYTGGKLIMPPVPDVDCREYSYYLIYLWANNDLVRNALHVRKGTVNEWQRCNWDLDYTCEIESSVVYQFNLTSSGYRALVYSGDHDAGIPFLGTQAWIRSLNFPVVDDWHSWSVDGQVAGYTRSYSNNLTFATVKGAGHTAPEYKPKECLAMLQRWISHSPL
uniref:Serine carboxypeptidase-like 18 n=1 Tax=Anthurium amnicola TaxID=1678845 RepID=A0A1D1ZC60_9ARAE